MCLDRRLIERMQAGDEAAFDTLFDRHATAIRQHLLGIVRDEPAAEDLLQDVFLRLWTRCEQWQGEGPLIAWLMRIATNVALNHLRSQRRRPTRPLQVHAESEDESRLPGWMIDDAALGPDELMERAEQQRMLWMIVQSLPESKREVLRLVYEQQMDIAEAADHLGIASGTVKSRLHYARSELERQWRQWINGQTRK